MEKAQFPALDEGLIYLDSAATTLKPECVIDTLSHFYLYECATIHRALYGSAKRAEERYYQSRVKLQKFLHAEHPEEIIFTRGATHSLNLLAQSFSKTFLGEGDSVVVSEVEHHSNIVSWQIAAEERGFTLRFVRVDDRGHIDRRHLAELLTEHRVKLLSIAHISNITGVVQEVKEIIRMSHAAHCYVCLDGAQAVAHLPIDVTSLNVDFYLFSSHKMYGPTGVGVLYGKKFLLEQLIPLEGGGGMVDKVTLEGSTFDSLPHKFEAGTPPIAEVIGLGAAVDFIQSLGCTAIYKHEQSLRVYADKRLREAFEVDFLGKSESALISFNIKEMHALDIATLLDCKKIALRSGHLCSQPAMRRFGVTETLRISFGVYNSKQDIDFFIEALQDVIALVGV